MALSEMAIRHARVTGKDYTLADSDGLILHITAQGGKVWHFRYYWAGKQKRMSFGSYPQLGLRDARIKRDEARALIAQSTIQASNASNSVLQFASPAIMPSRPCSISRSPSAA